MLSTNETDFTTCCSVPIFDFEQVNASWDLNYLADFWCVDRYLRK